MAVQSHVGILQAQLLFGPLQAKNGMIETGLDQAEPSLSNGLPHDTERHAVQVQGIAEGVSMGPSMGTHDDPPHPRTLSALSGHNLLTREMYGFRHAQLKVVAHRDRLSPSLDHHGLAIVTDR